MSYFYSGRLIPRAKELRKAMTQPERHLWYDFLRTYPVKIYKQRVIDNYIADFYCAQAKLVIELDGSQHYTEEGIEYDQIRTQIFNQYGLSVLRFSNSDVDNNFDGVCQMIDCKIKNQMR